MVRKVMLEKPWPPVALWTGGPAPQEWEGFSFSNITLRNYTLPQKTERYSSTKQIEKQLKEYLEIKKQVLSLWYHFDIILK